MYCINETKLLKSVHLVKIFEIQTKSTEFRPNSDRYWANGLNSDRLRKIRPEWQQCINPHTLVRSFCCLEENMDQLLIDGPSINLQKYPFTLLILKEGTTLILRA